MRSVTIDEIMALDPCDKFPRERVELLFNGRETMSVQDIAATDIVTSEKVNVILQTHMLGEIEESLRSLFLERTIIPDELVDFINSKEIAECAHCIRKIRKRRGEASIQEEAEWQLQKILEL